MSQYDFVYFRGKSLMFWAIEWFNMSNDAFLTNMGLILILIIIRCYMKKQEKKYMELKERENNGGWFCLEEKHAVIPETVGQFAGTDKNGTKIFEGDILKFDYTGKSLGVEGVAAVCFESGKFGVHWGWHKEFVALDGFTNTKITVIGNIDDNPELLDR